MLITRDNSVPEAPPLVTVKARPAGELLVQWDAPMGDSVVSGYNLYRSTALFSAKEDGTLLNTSEQIQSRQYTDLPQADGKYYYGVTAVSRTGVESQLSMVVSATADSVLPIARQITYSPLGPVGPGTIVAIDIEVSEPLTVTPFFSLNVPGSSPLNIHLSPSGPQSFSGHLVIDNETPSGEAWAVFSARDDAGNRGSEIESGGSLTIDTKGPKVVRLTILPQAPILNDESSPVEVRCIAGFNEAVKSGTKPNFEYSLSSHSGTVAVTSVVETTPQTGEVQAFEFGFILPSDGGLVDSETLSLHFSAIDELENAGNIIEPVNAFQIYQGELPPLSAPFSISAEPLANGKIALEWKAVDGASGYEIHRQAPGETELTLLSETEADSISFIDSPSVEGEYQYAALSLRTENGETSKSGLCPPVVVNSDSTAPAAPSNLSLEMASSGVLAQWDPVEATEDEVSYNLYRSSEPEISSVDGLTPVLGGISGSGITDTSPSVSMHTYVVTAVDQAGNESLPSNSVYLNFDLLPVKNLVVRLAEDDFPVLSFDANEGDIAGYEISIDGSIVDGNFQETQFVDTGYTQDSSLSREYSVVAIDALGHRSLTNSVTLANVSIELSDAGAATYGEQVIKRNLMNRLDFIVSPEFDALESIEGVTVSLAINGIDHDCDSVFTPEQGSTSQDICCCAGVCHP